MLVIYPETKLKKCIRNQVAMKKTLLFIAAAVAIVAACSKVQEQEVSLEVSPEVTDTPKAKYVTTFSGSLNTTKISIGAENDGVYNALWEDDDVLTVYAGDGETELGTATLDSGEGDNMGVFILETTEPIEDGTTVILKYGNAGGVPTEQTQSGAGASSLKNNYTTASSGEVTVSDGKASFTMTHTNAVIRVSVVATTDDKVLPAGATVSAVVLRCIGGGAVSGSVDDETDKDYVRVTLDTPLILSSTAQDVWMTTNAIDLTGNEIDIAFVVTNSSGETYTLPIGYNGKNLAANTVTKFANKSTSKCVPWYVPHDKRLMAGAGYAYGPANTFFIQCKNGNTYTGGTYTANDDIDNSVSIDIKPRGDFLKVINPKGCTFDWAKLGTITTAKKNGSGSVYIARKDKGLTDNAIDPTQYSKSYDNNFTVTVTNNAAYAGAPILLMFNKDNEIVWGWSFWNIAADGTPKVSSIDVGGVQMANMVIGQASTMIDTWPSGIGVEQCFSYYQWGRFLPIFWHNWPTVRAAGSLGGGVVPIMDAPLDIYTATQEPFGGIIDYDKPREGLTNWCESDISNLWGSPNNSYSSTGIKSNYDPCPEGWRVPDPKGYLQISKDLYAGDITVTKTTENNKHSVTINTASSSTTLYGGGFYVGKFVNEVFDSSNRLTLYGTGAPSTASDYSGRYWTNKRGSKQGVVFMFSTCSDATGCSDGYSGGDTSNFRCGTLNLTAAMPIRCQVDENYN